MSNALIAADPRDPLIGRILAEKYELVSLVGVGAMGRVYRATQRPLQRVVAVKVLHANLAGDEQARHRFLREARAASRFEHPNSMRVFDYGVELDGVVYIVLEFLEGKSLQQIIDAEGPLALPRIVQIMSEALSALAAAHDAGIVHRDLKPENIMLVTGRDEDGEDVESVKVADFGIAKVVEEREDGTPKLTATGLVPGTPAYMSPEQAGGKPVDARSDLYACGVILYEMATKRLPFFADNAIAVVLKHLTEIPTPPSKLNPSIDPRLEAIILRTLNKLPGDRFSDARAMRAALRETITQVMPVVRSNDAAPFTEAFTPTPGPVEKVIPASTSGESTPAQDNTAPPVTASTERVDPSSRSKVLPWVAASVALAAIVAFVAPRAAPPRPPDTRPAVIVVSSGDTQQPPPETPLPGVVEAPVEQSDASVESADSAAPAVETPDVPAVASPPESTARPSHTQSPSRRTRPGVVRAEDAATEPEPPPLLPQHTPSSETSDVPAESPSTPPPATTPTSRNTEPTPTETPPATPPTPTLRHVRGELENLVTSGGIPRGQVQPRALRAVSSLAQCVERNALARGASAMTAPMVCTVAVNVRDRRVDGVTFSPRSSLTAPCEGAVRSAFSGELPQSEDTEYTVTLRAALTPETE